MNIDDQLAEYLNSQGFGVFDPEGVSGNIFISLLPAEPSEAVAIFRTGGFGSDDKLGYAKPSLQLLVRGGSDPRTPRDKAQAIYDALHGYRNKELTAGGLWVVSCLGIQDGPVYIGRDDVGRHEYSLNFVVEVKHPTKGE